MLAAEFTGGYPSFGFAENTDDLFIGKTLLHGDVLMWLMKILLTSGCTNQRGAGQPDYTDPITFNAKISSPQVGQFVGLVRKLNALMISMDTLWLSSVLSNKQRVDGNYAWQQRIIKLARRIIDIEIRARKSAKAKGKEAEVEQAVPSTDDEITEEETDTPAN